MDAVTDVDRKAAEELRVLLADLSGFWFTPGDSGPLCAALARHRAQCEVHLLEKISHSGVPSSNGRSRPIKAARRELRYWSTRQSTAQLMDKPDGSRVAFGCTVTFEMNRKQRVVTTVGDDEADHAAGLLSFSAPLSRALMDAEPGESMDFADRENAIVSSPWACPLTDDGEKAAAHGSAGAIPVGSSPRDGMAAVHGEA